MKSLPLFGNLCVVLTAATIASAQPLTTARDDYPSSLGARGITSADFNRDGWTDVATANEGPNGVSVLLNRGVTGGFTTSFVPLTGGPFDIAAGDLNKDAIPDLAVANADGNLINVLLGRASGGFGAPLNIGAIGNPRGLTIADMNADGNLDIIYTQYTVRSVQILFGDGAGNFPIRSGSATTGVNPQGIVAADFNLDGRMDLAVACNGAPGLSILFQQPPGTFLRQDVPGHTSLNVLTATDFNRDGRVDIAVVSTRQNLVAFYANTRASGVVHSVSYINGSSPRGIATGDLNRDGIPDVVMANRALNTIRLLFGSGKTVGGLAGELELAAGTGSRVATVADFDNDGRLDIASGNEFASNVTVLSNTTSFIQAGFAFHRQRIGVVASTATGLQSAALADFDHDGKTDAVTEHFPRGFDTILGSGRRLPAAADSLQIGRMEAALLNSDAHPDVAGIEPSLGNAPSILWTFLGDGTGRFPNAITTDTSLFVASLALADLNRDGKMDALVAGTTPGNQSEWFARAFIGRGDGGFTTMPAVAIKMRANGIVVADVNRDGIPDFAAFYDSCCTNGNARVDIFKGDGRGGFTALESIGFSHWYTVVGADFADLDHDGFLDLVADGYSISPTFFSTPGIAIAPGSGQGFGEPRFRDMRIEFSTGQLRLADMNVDGNVDLVTSAGDLLLGMGDLTFGPAQGFVFFRDNHRIADFDTDGLPDIVYGFSDGSVDVLLNQRQATNTAPVVDAGADRTFTYDVQFEEEPLQFNALGADADVHRLRFEWRDPAGHVVSNESELELTGLNPGTYPYSVTVNDGRGGIASDTFNVTILPMPEVVVHAAQDFASTEGNWEIVADGSAASGLRLHDRNLGAPKVTRPLAAPASSGQIGFVADPTQTYKLWIRLKADANTWMNDSVWLQISGAVDAAGNPIAEPGTASGIEINLEECSGCGVSGWGWRDEAWGQKGAIGALTLRFPQGGLQFLRFQTREDGVSIDQFVLSAEKYRTTRPGAVKNDATILPPTLLWQRF